MRPTRDRVVAVAQEVRGLDGRQDAERCEAREVGEVDELGVLDSVLEAAAVDRADGPRSPVTASKSGDRQPARRPASTDERLT